MSAGQLPRELLLLHLGGAGHLVGWHRRDQDHRHRAVLRRRAWFWNAERAQRAMNRKHAIGRAEKELETSVAESDLIASA